MEALVSAIEAEAGSNSERTIFSFRAEWWDPGVLKQAESYLPARRVRTNPREHRRGWPRQENIAKRSR